MCGARIAKPISTHLQHRSHHVGCLQNLCVVAQKDRFEVDAGGRRLMALKKLAKDGSSPRTFRFPANVVALEEGREVSLIENVHRVAMDAMDEVDAFAALVAEGATRRAVAQPFWRDASARRSTPCACRIVAEDQGGVEARRCQSWKRRAPSVSLKITRSRKRCSAALANRYACGSVRARLMEGRMRASDRLASFVGLEAYERAGVAVVRDLLTLKPSMLKDPALMAQLAEEKLEGERDSWLAQGWGWVETSLGQGRADGGYAAMRLQPDWREFTDAEEAELDAPAW
jgi:ParB family chromosome partitioning protein